MAVRNHKYTRIEAIDPVTAKVVALFHPRRAPLPWPPLGVNRLVGGASGLNLMELAGLVQTAEDDRNPARVHRLRQDFAVAAVGLPGHPVGSEGLVLADAEEHAGDQLAGRDPLADEFAEVVRLFLRRRRGSHWDSGQLRRRERGRLERLEVLPHRIELGGV